LSTFGIGLTVVAVAAAAFIVWVPDWTHPPVGGVQIAPPPASMVQFSRGHIPEPVSLHAPAALPEVPASGASAASVYRNVKVLADVDAAEFMRLQRAMTQWVAPAQGCAFCHEGEDYASDAKPTKTAARLMLRMVRHINADWGQHVGRTGVTCYTCHRGAPIPAETWFPSVPNPGKPWVAKQENWRESAETVRKFFPDAGWQLYLLEDTPISVQSTSALRGDTVAAQIVAKRVYEMMMQMSDGIGVNCGYCHNSRAFEDWSQSTPYRWSGFYGIRMTRDLNRNYLLALQEILPQTRERLNATRLPVIPARESGLQNGDGLVVCATCHYGQPRPLSGAALANTYPELEAKGAVP